MWKPRMSERARMIIVPSKVSYQMSAIAQARSPTASVTSVLPVRCAIPVSSISAMYRPTFDDEPKCV